jgi:hypothetical protein
VTSPQQLEREIQRQVKAAYEACGCFVANFSQGYRPGGKRHATTRQTKGIPDLYVFPPVREVRGPLAGHATVYLAPWWHETKRPGARQTAEQRTWQMRCEQRGVAYVLGGVAEAAEHLRKVLGAPAQTAMT